MPMSNTPSVFTTSAKSEVVRQSLLKKREIQQKNSKGILMHLPISNSPEVQAEPLHGPAC